jgi:hypothetical protein
LNKNLSENENPSAEKAFAESASCESAAYAHEPVVMLKRIGTTTYEIAVYFSKNSKETMSDKISRMIKNENLGRVVVGY